MAELLFLRRPAGVCERLSGGVCVPGDGFGAAFGWFPGATALRVVDATVLQAKPGGLMVESRAEVRGLRRSSVARHIFSCDGGRTACVFLAGICVLRGTTFLKLDDDDDEDGLVEDEGDGLFLEPTGRLLFVWIDRVASAFSRVGLTLSLVVFSDSL